VRLEAVDLRWGAYDAPDNMVKSCLDELDRGSEGGGMPWVIAIR
jgi:hypothetical protein